MSETKRTLAGCLATFIALPFASVFNGYVLSVLWRWFIVPVFHLPVLSIVQAIGISMVVTMFTYQAPEDVKGREWTDLIARMFAKPALGLFFGWIVRMWL